MNGQVHNLDDQEAEDFGFIVGGKEYRMRYPTTEEALTAQTFKEDSKEQLEWLYSFITPVEPESPPIQDILNKVSIKKLKKFTDMVISEFGDDES